MSRIPLLSRAWRDSLAVQLRGRYTILITHSDKLMFSILRYVGRWISRWHKSHVRGVLDGSSQEHEGDGLMGANDHGFAIARRLGYCRSRGPGHTT